MSAIFNYGLFAILYKGFGVYYVLSSGLGYLAGLIAGYFLNKSWTYRGQASAGRSYLMPYLAGYGVSLVASLLFLRFIVESGFTGPLIGNVLALGLSTVMNFAGTNWLVFTKQPSDDSYA